MLAHEGEWQRTVRENELELASVVAVWTGFAPRHRIGTPQAVFGWL
jgi:hypothetical protein